MQSFKKLCSDPVIYEGVVYDVGTAGELFAQKESYMSKVMGVDTATPVTAVSFFPDFDDKDSIRIHLYPDENRETFHPTFAELADLPKLLHGTNLTVNEELSNKVLAEYHKRAARAAKFEADYKETLATTIKAGEDTMEDTRRTLTIPGYHLDTRTSYGTDTVSYISDETEDDWYDITIPSNCKDIYVVSKTVLCSTVKVDVVKDLPAYFK